MTAGQSGRGYGRDEWDQPPYDSEVGRYRVPEPDQTGSWQQSAWQQDEGWNDSGAHWQGQDWQAPSDHTGQWQPPQQGYGSAEQYGTSEAYDPDATGSWQRDTSWSGGGHQPAAPAWSDQFAQPTGYRDDSTQVFSRPAGGYGADDYYTDGYGGRWHGQAGEPVAAAGRDAEPGSARSGGERKRRGLTLWQEIPLLLVIAFCLAILVRTFLLQAFFIPSGSMEDTLLAGDRVLVNKVVYKMREPARGEVVVFRGTDAWAPQHAADGDIGTFAKVGRVLGDLVGISHPDEKDYIKRIIGLPGDRVSCCDVDGRIFVNGQPIDEDYVVHNAPLVDAGDHPNDCRRRRFDETVVEPGQMFVLGDHRAASQDSRCQGQVPIDNIKGRAFVIVWPSSRWTGLPAPEVFDAVPHAGGPSETVVVDPPPSGLVLLPMLMVSVVTFHRFRRVPRPPGIGEAVGSRSD